MKIKKIMTSILEGSFWGKVNDKIESVTPFLRIKNENARFYVRECNSYEKIYKKYNKKLEDKTRQINSNSSVGEKSNKIWICWFQGYEQAPDIVKACINSVKRNMPHKEIVILTNENIKEYIELPDYIQKKYEKGIIKNAHYSDILRIAVLCKYGGTWMDATLLCTNPFPDYIENSNLFMFKEIDLMRRDKTPSLASSWFISACSNNKILVMTRELLYEYWKENNYLEHYFLFHLFLSISARQFIDEWNQIPTYNNHSPHIMMFELGDEFSQERWNQILSVSCLHKLTHHLKFDESCNSIYSHIIKEYL